MNSLLICIVTRLMLSIKCLYETEIIFSELKLYDTPLNNRNYILETKV